MDIQLKYPFPEVNVTVDCGGGRVNGPVVNIAIENGAVDARKSDVRITGEYHLHPFQGVKADPAQLRSAASAIPDVGAMFDGVLADLDALDAATPDAPKAAVDLQLKLVLEVRALKDVGLALVEMAEGRGARADPESVTGGLTGDDPVREEAFKELVNLVVAKLVELTPSHPWAHAWYGTTQADLIANATQIVAQLKDSPTLAALMRSLTGLRTEPVPRKVDGQDVSAGLYVAWNSCVQESDPALAAISAGAMALMEDEPLLGLVADTINECLKTPLKH
jgi:hypothetical protein